MLLNRHVKIEHKAGVYTYKLNRWFSHSHMTSTLICIRICTHTLAMLSVFVH